MFQLTHFMNYPDRRDEKSSFFPSKLPHLVQARYLQQQFKRLPCLDPQWEYRSYDSWQCQFSSVSAGKTRVFIEFVAVTRLLYWVITIILNERRCQFLSRKLEILIPWPSILDEVFRGSLPSLQANDKNQATSFFYILASSLPIKHSIFHCCIACRHG